jgi:hypothetical protein
MVYAPRFFHILGSIAVNFSKLNFNELRRGFADDRLLVLRDRIPQGTWLSVSCECCVFSGRSLCVGLINRPGEFYKCGVTDCDRKSLDNEETLATRDCRTKGQVGSGMKY